MFTNRFSRFVTVLLVIAVFFGTASFVKSAATAPKIDRSYDSLEQARALRAVAPAASTSNYDLLEAVRVQRNSFTVQAAYDVIEQVRLSRGISTDHSYDSIESLRLER